MSIYRNILGMLSALRRLRRREFWTRAEIQAHQAQALQHLRTHAYAHSPFYRDFHAGRMDRPLEELPILTKSMLNAHFDEIVTDPRITRAKVAEHMATLQGAESFLGEYFANTTSGTTGDSTYILFNRAAWATALASFTRFEQHIGSLWGMIQRPKMAVVASSTPWHISARIGTTVRSSWLPMLRLDVGEPIDRIVEQLNAWQPHLLATYASMAAILAEEQAAGRLQIAPRRVVSSAEVLSPALRRRLQSVWGDIVFNQYGATEGGTFAVECESPYRSPQAAPDQTVADLTESDRADHPRRGLHVFEDLFIFEVVDEHNRPVPPGQYGDKVLLTVLFNHAQPLIRYELSDRVRMSPLPCACGRGLALIDDIQGRREEILRFPGFGDHEIAVHPMVFYRILDATPVHGWQVIHTPDKLCLHLTGEPAKVDAPALIATVKQALAQLGAVPPPIEVEWSSSVARGTTGKAARIVKRQTVAAHQ
ncbi:MAG: AMP-binding protein [Litorilinea sp.]